MVSKGLHVTGKRSVWGGFQCNLAANMFNLFLQCMGGTVGTSKLSEGWSEAGGVWVLEALDRSVADDQAVDDGLRQRAHPGGRAENAGITLSLTIWHSPKPKDLSRDSLGQFWPLWTIFTKNLCRGGASIITLRLKFSL